MIDVRHELRIGLGGQFIAGVDASLCEGRVVMSLGSVRARGRRFLRMRVGGLSQPKACSGSLSFRSHTDANRNIQA